MKSRFYVRADTAALKAALSSIEQSQLPFATARALTTTAKQGQAAVRARLPQIFTIRTTWLDKGIQVRSASKRDLRAAVVSRDEFMGLQETGGEKKPRKGRAIGVPKAIREPKTKVTKPSEWPGALLARSAKAKPRRRKVRGKGSYKKPKFFLTTLKKGRRAGLQAVVQRDDPMTRYPLRVLYVLQPSVRVKGDLKMRETVAAVVSERFASNFSEALAEALRTAKPKAARR
jgi:hypothetical protein